MPTFLTNCGIYTSVVFGIAPSATECLFKFYTGGESFWDRGLFGGKMAFARMLKGGDFVAAA